MMYNVKVFHEDSLIHQYLTEADDMYSSIEVQDTEYSWVIREIKVEVEQVE